MCDQDTVERVGRFLGYKPVSVKHHMKDDPHWSPAWVNQVRNEGGLVEAWSSNGGSTPQQKATGPVAGVL